MWKELMGSGLGRHGARLPDQVRASICKTKNSTGNATLVVSIGESVMRDMRWVVGDKVSFFADEDTKGIMLVRTPSGRATLSPTNSAKGMAKKLAGRTAGSQCSVSVAPFVAEWVRESRIVPHRVTSDGLVILTNGTVA